MWGLSRAGWAGLPIIVLGLIQRGDHRNCILLHVHHLVCKQHILLSKQHIFLSIQFLQSSLCQCSVFSLQVHFHCSQLHQKLFFQILRLLFLLYQDIFVASQALGLAPLCNSNIDSPEQLPQQLSRFWSREQCKHALIISFHCRDIVVM